MFTFMYPWDIILIDPKKKAKGVWKNRPEIECQDNSTDKYPDYTTSKVAITGCKLHWFNKFCAFLIIMSIIYVVFEFITRKKTSRKDLPHPITVLSVAGVIFMFMWGVNTIYLNKLHPKKIYKIY